MADRNDTRHAPLPLPAGVTSHVAETGAGLSVHYLSAGPKWPARGTLLLLHGFPELAFSWRHVMPRLAEAGFRVIAPDQRGYGRTTGGAAVYDTDLSAFGMVNLVRDQIALLAALDIPRVEAVIGHDFGSPVAAWCALIRSDIFRAVACMSAPFGGPPGWEAEAGPDIHAALATLTPPRRHYQWWYSEPGANDDMMKSPGGLARFLRAYFHCKSADWAGNSPHRLDGWTAHSLALLPRYYVMDEGVGMAATALSMAPSSDEAASCRWLSSADLAVYAAEYGRTGFQGGLNWYRRATSDAAKAELRLFAGRRITVPACFVGGAQDWGVWQVPGALQSMERTATSDWRGTVLIDGAGHWVQQEQPAATVAALSAFLDTL